MLLLHTTLPLLKIYLVQKTKRLMLLRGRAAKRFKNYGELLYHEALYKDAERRRIAEQRHLEEESNELKEITATPEIR